MYIKKVLQQPGNKLAYNQASGIEITEAKFYFIPLEQGNNDFSTGYKYRKREWVFSGGSWLTVPIAHVWSEI